MQKETRRNSAAGSTKPNPPRKLTRAEKKQIAEIIRQAKGDGKAHTAQQTIPYIQMYPDGICKVTGRKYSKTVAFEDINYQLAQADDKTAIFENWCSSLSSIRGRSGAKRKRRSISRHRRTLSILSAQNTGIC